MQEKAVAAYHQAMLTAKIISGGDVGEVFEEFPYWNEDEILDFKADRTIRYFNDVCE